MTDRQLTGSVTFANDTTIDAGTIIATPYGQLPASESEGLLLPKRVEFDIVDGVIVAGSTIVAPAYYLFEVFDGNDVHIYSWRAPVPEGEGSISLQTIYQLQFGSVEITPAIIDTINDAIAGHNHNLEYSPIDHNHDLDYAPVDHHHDDRYYTETEVDNFLGLYAPVNHSHDGLLPTGGSEGQLLSKATGDDHDTLWIDPPQGSGGAGLEHFGFAPNRYYSAPGGGIYLDDVTPTSNRIYYVPFCMPSTTLIRMAIQTLTAAAAGSRIRIGLYENDGGNPGNLVVDAGEVLIDTVGVREIILSHAIELGNYWIAFNMESSCKIKAYERLRSTYSSIIGRNSAGANVTSLYENHTYGAMPSSAGSSLLTDTNNAGHVMVMGS